MLVKDSLDPGLVGWDSEQYAAVRSPVSCSGPGLLLSILLLGIVAVVFVAASSIVCHLLCCVLWFYWFAFAHSICKMIGIYAYRLDSPPQPEGCPFPLITFAHFHWQFGLALLALRLLLQLGTHSHLLSPSTCRMPRPSRWIPILLLLLFHVPGHFALYGVFWNVSSAA